MWPLKAEIYRGHVVSQVKAFPSLYNTPLVILNYIGDQTLTTLLIRKQSRSKIGAPITQSSLRSRSNQLTRACMRARLNAGQMMMKSG